MGDGDDRQRVRRSRSCHAVKGRLSKHWGGQFGLGDDHEVRAINDRFQTQERRQKISRWYDAPTDGCNDRSDSATCTGTALASRVHVRSVEQLVAPKRTMGEHLCQSGSKSGVLCLNRLQIWSNGEDRVEAQKRALGRSRAHEVHTRFGHEALRAREGIGECLRLPRIDAGDIQETFEKPDAAIGRGIMSTFDNHGAAVAECIRHALARLARRRGLGGHAHERGLGTQRSHGLVEGGSGSERNREHCRLRSAGYDTPADGVERLAGRRGGNSPIPPTGDNDTFHRDATRVSRSASARIAAFRSEIDCDSSSEWAFVSGSSTPVTTT